jgi:hypothetical protein
VLLCSSSYVSDTVSSGCSKAIRSQRESRRDGGKWDKTRFNEATAINDQDVTYSLERRLEHFEAARRADFEAYKERLEERDGKHQEELQAMERRILEVSNKQ